MNSLDKTVRLNTYDVNDSHCTQAQHMLCHNYRTTRIHSADYAVARCLSVRPSVTRRYSVETAKHIMKDFLPSGRQVILVFSNETG